MSQTLITARSLKKKYAAFEAVKGIDFDIYQGECFALLGPNGAGKSSTLKMMVGLSEVSAGDLYLFDLSVKTHIKQIKGQMGVVPQEDNLDPDLTVLDNLILYAHYFDIPKNEAKKRALELLSFLQLEEKKDVFILKLSGGMKRRLVIARSLIHNPKILILDEPTTGLDPQARRLIWSKLKLLKQNGVTLVLTTHYMEEAYALCDRVAMMHEGKILAMGSPLELIEKMLGNEVVEIKAEQEVLKTWQKKFSDLSSEIYEDTLYFFLKEEHFKLNSELLLNPNLSLTKRPPTLEDVFLKVSGRDLKD